VIRHLVAFRFAPDLPAAARQAVLDELATFPERYPAMRRFYVGENISQRDRTYTHALVVEFDTEAELLEYLNSDTHEAFVAERFRPAIDGRVIVTVED
jgi:2,3-dihydroxy-p-cumate/2,3-dihydroxybenzoate 3,4-dioxygenase